MGAVGRKEAGTVSARRRGINGNRKGKRAELEVVRLFRVQGYPAERGQQHDGLSGSADVVGVPYIWIEVKRREGLGLGTDELESAMCQAERDSRAYMERNGIHVVPVVIHRKNNSPWCVSTRVAWFMELLLVPPFVAECCGGMVTMLFDEWIGLYEQYRADRDRGVGDE